MKKITFVTLVFMLFLSMFLSQCITDNDNNNNNGNNDYQLFAKKHYDINKYLNYRNHYVYATTTDWFYNDDSLWGVDSTDEYAVDGYPWHLDQHTLPCEHQDTNSDGIVDSADITLNADFYGDIGKYEKYIYGWKDCNLPLTYPEGHIYEGDYFNSWCLDSSYTKYVKPAVDSYIADTTSLRAQYNSMIAK